MTYTDCLIFIALVAVVAVADWWRANLPCRKHHYALYQVGMGAVRGRQTSAYLCRKCGAMALLHSHREVQS